MSKKVEKSSATHIDTLPDYLGLGLLVTHSVVKSQDKVSADYIWENEILYKVALSKSTCQIVEFFGGKQIATTSGGESLQRTFFNHLASQLPYQSKQFEKLFHKLVDDRNVYVRFASQPSYLYYPAGYIFFLRQPIVSSNKSILSRVEKILATLHIGEINLESKRDGVILKMSKNGKVLVEQVEIVDFCCTLFHLDQFVDMLWKSGIVPEQKEYRLTVLDSSESTAGNIIVYLGEISRNFLTFSVVVTEGADLDMAEVQKMFIDASIQFLDRQKK